MTRSSSSASRMMVMATLQKKTARRRLWCRRPGPARVRACWGASGRGGSYGISKAFRTWQQIVAPRVAAISTAALALDFAVFLVVVGAFIAAVTSVLAWIAHGLPLARMAAAHSWALPFIPGSP